MYFFDLNEIVSKVRRNNFEIKVMMRRRGKGRAGGVHDVPKMACFATYSTIVCH